VCTLLDCLQYCLYVIGFWTFNLLKDTIFWIISVEFPLFAKTIGKAKDNHFFVKLIKDNIGLIVIIKFILNFWTFSLFKEIIIVPVTVIVGFSYAFASREKKYHKIKLFFNCVFIVFGIIVIINTIIHVFQSPTEFWNINSLKTFLLPILLLILNLPIVYGLALYSAYELVFIRIKGNEVERPKMKWSIIRFAGIYLYKITTIQNKPIYTTLISLTNEDMENNLKKLEKRLSMQIGYNYTKRAYFYIMWSVLGLLICVAGIIFCNTHVYIKEMISFKLALDITRIKEIITNICSTGLVFFFCMLIYSIGLKKKKNEEISQVKKYVLYNFLYMVNRQHSILQEFPPIDAPKELFLQYIVSAYELKLECDKNIALFENLLTTCELDTIKQLQTSTYTLVCDIGINEAEISKYTPDSFYTYFVAKKAAAPQSEKINVFIDDVEKGIEKYSEQIKICFEEFNNYIK